MTRPEQKKGKLLPSPNNRNCIKLRNNYSLSQIKFQREHYKLNLKKQQADAMRQEREKLAALQEKLNQERAQFQAEKIAWQLSIAAQEQCFSDRNLKIQSVEKSMQEELKRMAADRKELDHYFSIDQAQRQILANLNAIQKEKSLTNRFWSWFGFSFRKP